LTGNDTHNGGHGLVFETLVGIEETQNRLFAQYADEGLLLHTETRQDDLKAQLVIVSQLVLGAFHFDSVRQKLL
jgi:hypothetical protein